jgi:hypothetical protein
MKIKRVLSESATVTIDGVRYEGAVIKTGSRKLYLVVDERNHNYYLVGAVHRPAGRRVFRRDGKIFIELKGEHEINVT